MRGLGPGAAWLLVTATALSPGCRGSSAPPARTQALRVSMAPEVHGLDPHRQTAHGGLSVLSNVYEGLTSFDEAMHVVPGLAIRWESPDELTWRFHLRPGVLFHDGRPLRAADVVRSLERARQPGGNVRGGMGVIQRVESPAANVVEIHTSRPSLMLLNNLASVFIVPQDAPEEIRAPIGTGPYRVSAFQPERHLDLLGWDQYWNGAPALPEVSFAFEAEPQRRLESLAAGSVDVALRLPETTAAPPSAGYRVVWRLAPGTRVLGLRVDRPPFSDVRVRRALNLAVDRDAMALTLLAGRGAPVGQPLPTGIFGHVPDLAIPRPDLVAARRWLLEASAQNLGVTLDHGRGRQEEAEAVAAQIRRAGLRVTLRPRNVAELLPLLDSGDAQMVLFSYVLVAGDADDFFENVLHSRDASRGYGAENRFGYRNAAVDGLIERAATSPMDERLSLYQQAARAAMDDLPVIPLWQVPWVYGLRVGVQWTPTAHGWFDAAHARRP